MANFKYLRTTLTINNFCLHEEINGRVNFGNVYYHSVRNLWSSCLPYNNRKAKTHKNIILPVVLYGCEAWSFYTKGRTQAEGVREQGAEEDSWAKENNNRTVEKTKMRCITICYPYQI